MFTKYQKKNNDSKVLLLYLLLNGNDMEKIKLIEETEDSKRKVVYGVTSEAVNGRKFEQEIEAIEAPTVCSEQSYELYSDSKIIHIYTKSNAEQDFRINDMAVISKTMVILEDCVVSSNVAHEAEEVETYGFMHFYNYALNGEMNLGKWHVVYKDNEFKIFYKGDENKEFLLFSSIEIDRTATYKFVLYIIFKSQEEIMNTEGVPPDNYKITDYELVVKE